MTPRSSTLLLLVAACLVPAVAAVVDTSRLDLGGGTINICTSEYTPIVFCVDREPSQYGGYEIELFERVRLQLGWDPSRFNWSCTDWDSMISSLQAGDGVCDLGVAGIDVNIDYLAEGIIFTFPTLSSGGYRILVPAEQDASATFAFMSAFTWQLWVAIICTMVVVGCILWAVERWANLVPPPLGAPPPPGLQRQIWTSLGRPMQTVDMRSHNFAGNLIIIVFSFSMLILVTLYTANTAANLTATRLTSTIRSVEDLPGKVVATYDDPVYMSDMTRRGIIPKGYPWETTADEQVMFDAVANGDVDALVLDSYVLEWNAASRCDVQVVGDTWEQYDQAVAFSSAFEDSPVIKEYNKALVQLKTSGDMESLQKQYVDPPEATCKSRGVTDTTASISFMDVAGLWIVLAASVGVALILVLLSQVVMHSARRVAATKAFQAGTRRIQTIKQRTMQTSRSMQAWKSRSTSGRGKSASLGTEGRQSDLEGQALEEAQAAAAVRGEQAAYPLHTAYPPPPHDFPPAAAVPHQQDAALLAAQMADVLAAVRGMQQHLQGKDAPEC